MTVQSFIKFYSKLRPQERRQTHRQTDAGDLIICPMLCYSNGTDKNIIVPVVCRLVKIWQKYYQKYRVPYHIFM